MPGSLHDGCSAAIADRFGLGAAAALRGPTGRGDLGQVWRLETRLGTWAVKETFAPLDPREAEAAAAHQEAVAAAGVPAPAVVRTADDGAAMALVEGVQVRVYRWVDLRDPDVTLDPAAVGRTLAAIHGVPIAADGPVDPWYTEPVGADRWRSLARDVTAVDPGRGRALAELCDDLVELESWLEPATAPQRCHRDLWADNLRSTTDRRPCVIDWDNGGPADPGQELAMVLFEFGGDDPGRERALHDAYRAAGGPGRITGRGAFSLVIAQIGNIGSWSLATLADRRTAGADRERAAGRVDEFLDRALTPARIDALLAAIAP